MQPSKPDEKMRNGCRRDDALVALTAEPLDLLVIGGGITGAGTARDGAMRGMRIGLVEQHDFAYGSSSRSARLLHGGIRYLAQGNFRLVRQASLEKVIVHQIAPHIALPLPFIFPTYRGTPWPQWKLHIGVKLYDLLCNRRNFGSSALLSRDAVKSLLPSIQTDGLTGGVRYFDGLTNDARLVIDTLRSAEQAGALTCNYTRMEDAQRDGKLWVCRLYDILTDTVIKVRARSVVNATGAWADMLPQSQIKIRGTKGIHVIMDRCRFEIPDEAVMMTEQKRVVWAIPWGERVYVGCTDTDFQDALEDVNTKPEDVRYILGVVNNFFPALKLTEADVLSSWAGVRPLVANANGTPSDVSRSHLIKMSRDGWIDAAGGKLTTYRLMAQEIIDKAGLYLDKPLAPCRTAREPLLSHGEAEGISSVVPPQVTPGAVRVFCHREWAVHLEDVMIRRTRWHYYEPDKEAVAEKVAGWMAEELRWDGARRRAEMGRYRRVRD